MQAFNQSRIRPAVFALGMLMLGWIASEPAAQPAQGATSHVAKRAKPEFGTGVAVDAQNRIWMASKETEGDAQYVVLQRSEDDGKTWTEPRRVQTEPEAVSADGENRPKIAFGTKGEIYISYTRPLSKPYTGDIRFIRSIDGGESFSAPITVHANRDVISHRFDSMMVDRTGRIYIAWVDKRDLEAASARKEKYAGAAVYYAISEDGGASFKGDYKVADHSCECCRIGMALNPDGKPELLWRHVFAPNVRDHAIAELTPAGKASAPVRASFDNWRIDACPHHGPALAYASDGKRHQAWFNVKGDEGGVFYASANPAGKLSRPMRLGSAQAQHPDVAVDGRAVAVVWKQFDGESTAVLGRLSSDGGRTWQDRELARTAGESDQPRLLKTASGIVLAWRTQDAGMQIIPFKQETR
ncbi:sialidase family protein [Oxalobacteraceae bacterium R-40]|uniref:Sialidase family protein n=1 Tax=Keguizhuia sedimenti TaxID=3064264 RepID=A0ABU1BT11_9BURK|nr:sialidase family protein [Oxalobacteraceae bacterium R-40]